MMKSVPFGLALGVFALGLAGCGGTEPAAGAPPAAFVVGATAPVTDAAGPAPKARAEQPSSASAGGPADSGHRMMIRFMGDLDDILDQIRGPASFEEAKPRLLARVHEHAAWVAKQPNPGMTQMSRAVAKDFQTAVNRHAQSLLRAEGVAPGVEAYFSKELGPVLTAK